MHYRRPLAVQAERLPLAHIFYIASLLEVSVKVLMGCIPLFGG